MTRSIEVQGAKEIRSALRQIDPELRRQLRSVNLEAAKQVLPLALQLVPRRSGRLLGSIRALASQREGRVAAGRKSVPYAGPIHFGWPAHHIRPQPFLYDALDRRREDVINTYKRRLDLVIDTAMRRTLHEG